MTTKVERIGVLINTLLINRAIAAECVRSGHPDASRASRVAEIDAALELKLRFSISIPLYDVLGVYELTAIAAERPS